MPKRFLIAALPRSRTAWLANWFGASGLLVGHDMGKFCETPEDFLAFYAKDMTGTCETGLGNGLELFRRQQPQANVVIVHRPVGEVLQSFRKKGFEPEGLEQQLFAQEKQLLAFAQQCPVLRFSDLESPDACAWLWEHLIGTPFDFGVWNSLRQINVQVNFPEHIAYLAGAQKRLEGLRLIIDQQLANGTAWPEVRQETWAELSNDTGFDALVNDHAKEADGLNSIVLDKAMLGRAEAAGQLLCFCARLNDELVGYLTFGLSPHLYAPGRVLATMGGFYVRPGLTAHAFGKKLLALALQRIHQIPFLEEIIFHAPSEGRGQKLSGLFARLGALPHHKTFSLKVN